MTKVWSVPFIERVSRNTNLDFDTIMIFKNQNIEVIVIYLYTSKWGSFSTANKHMLWRLHTNNLLSEAGNFLRT